MCVMQQVCPVSIMKIVPPVTKAVSKSSKGTRLSDVLKADTQSAKKMEGSSSTGKMAEWEKRALSALQKHFAYKKLKAFQRDALEAWAENRDCFVLAATGSALCMTSAYSLRSKVFQPVSLGLAKSTRASSLRPWQACMTLCTCALRLFPGWRNICRDWPGGRGLRSLL
jgi:hypothetical protein